MLSPMVRFALSSLAGIALAGTPATYAADVGISININQPGFYGQIDIGNVPAPELIFSAPVIVARAAAPTAPPPLYLHVPPGHEKHWAKHCREYNACGRPVYFVTDRWYADVYAPAHHGRGDDDHRDRGNGHGQGHDEDHEHGHDHDHHHDGDDD